jgi:hypothetical protein
VTARNASFPCPHQGDIAIADRLYDDMHEEELPVPRVPYRTSGAANAVTGEEATHTSRPADGREEPGTTLQFAGGPVDISTFSAEPLESAVKSTTVATHCADCGGHLSGGDHSMDECARCQAETPRCLLWDDICSDCESWKNCNSEDLAAMAGDRKGDYDR